MDGKSKVAMRHEISSSERATGEVNRTQCVFMPYCLVHCLGRRLLRN